MEPEAEGEIEADDQSTQVSLSPGSRAHSPRPALTGILEGTPGGAMTTTEFVQAIAGLYPELGGAAPSLEQYAPSIILRVLNEGDPALQEAALAHYGTERVRAVAVDRIHRLSNPAYRHWAPRLNLPARPAAVERVQALWQR